MVWYSVWYLAPPHRCIEHGSARCRVRGVVPSGLRAACVVSLPAPACPVVCHVATRDVRGHDVVCFPMCFALDESARKTVSLRWGAMPRLT